MALEIPILAFIVTGALLAIRLPGPARRRVAIGYAVGAALALGGCGGALAWLGAETSGNANLAHRVNPLLWSAVFLAGVVVLFCASVVVFRERGRSNRPKR